MAASLSRFQTIFWDWNGTLINDPPLSCELLNLTIAKYGISSVSIEKYKELYQHPLTVLYERVGLDLTKISYEKIDVEWHEHYEKRAHEAPLHEGARSVLNRITQTGRSQHILSALRHRLLEQAIEQRELRHYFGEIRGQTSQKLSTKFDTGARLAEELEIIKEETVLIGDTSHDAEVATALGINCILIADGAEARWRLEATGFPVLDKLTELEQLL